MNAIATLNKDEEVVPVLLPCVVFKADLQLLLQQLRELLQVMLHHFLDFLDSFNVLPAGLLLLILQHIVLTSDLILGGWSGCLVV